MNTQSANSNAVETEVADLKAEIAALRRVVTTTLATVLLLTLALNGVFLWQVRAVRRQLSVARGEVAQYQRVAVPAMDEFLTRLERFAIAHPDFAPILGKYVPAKTQTPAPAQPTLRP